MGRVPTPEEIAARNKAHGGRWQNKDAVVLNLWLNEQGQPRGWYGIKDGSDGWDLTRPAWIENVRGADIPLDYYTER